MSMFVSASRVDCDSCSSSVKINFELPEALTWEKCDTLDKKVGFIVGQGVGYCKDVANKGFEATSRAYNSEPAKLFREKVGQASDKCAKAVKDFSTIVKDKFVAFAKSERTIKTMKWIDEAILAPVGRALKEFGKFIDKVVVQPLDKFLTDLNKKRAAAAKKARAERPKQPRKPSVIGKHIAEFVKLLNDKVLTPVGKKISEALESETAKKIGNKISKGCELTNEHVLKPIGRAIRSVFEAIGNFFHGVYSGVVHKEPVVYVYMTFGEAQAARDDGIKFKVLRTDYMSGDAAGFIVEVAKSVKDNNTNRWIELSKDKIPANDIIRSSNTTLQNALGLNQ